MESRRGQQYYVPGCHDDHIQVIDSEKSLVDLLGSKAEIKLRKADGTPWKYLELLKVAAAAAAAEAENNGVTDEQNSNEGIS